MAKENRICWWLKWKYLQYNIFSWWTTGPRLWNSFWYQIDLQRFSWSLKLNSKLTSFLMPTLHKWNWTNWNDFGSIRGNYDTTSQWTSTAAKCIVEAVTKLLVQFIIAVSYGFWFIMDFWQRNLYANTLHNWYSYAKNG